MFKGNFLEKDKDKKIFKNKLLELYEFLILTELYSTKFRNQLVLKGPVAADLVYRVGIVSNKIDFITLGDIKPIEFMSEINKLCKKYSNISIGKQEDQRYTFTLELIVTEDDDIKFELFIEFTKIAYKLKRGLNFDARIIAIPDWSNKPVILVSNLSEIIQEHPQISSLISIGLNQEFVNRN